MFENGKEEDYWRNAGLYLLGSQLYNDIFSVNLEEIRVFDCEKLEEIVGNRSDE